ncbi:MAG: hypothetical protein HC842_02130 [Cytophagales bacterium]|nr:hypothetical protein [Cytophagales bacterium]
MIALLQNTSLKIQLAKLLYALTRLAGFRTNRLITRRGISYRVNLAEALDLSLFWFGHYQNTW